MKKLTLIASAAAFLALPVASASAAGPEIPEINCGIVSCTYKVEQALETTGGLVEDVANCASGTVVAYWQALQGYPQMHYCEIG